MTIIEASSTSTSSGSDGGAAAGDPRGGDLLTDMAPRDEFFANNGRRPRPGRPSPEPMVGQEARASGAASAP